MTDVIGWSGATSFVRTEKVSFPFFLKRRQATMVRVVRVSQIRLGSVGLGFRPGSQMTMPRSIKVKLELMSFVTRDA